eukprot:7015340-Alexandrium_andersonii.AAC.1
MSASLVGSEMCIRDRRERSANGARTAREQSANRARTAYEQSANRARTAVSYTHLTLPTICSV